MPNNPPGMNPARARAYLDMAESRARVPPWLDASTPLRRLVRDYWRGEVTADSPALARLQSICRARGYDYQSTIGALK